MTISSVRHVLNLFRLRLTVQLQKPNYTLKPDSMISSVRSFLNLSRLKLTVAFAGNVAPKSLLWAIDMLARGAAGKGRSLYILKLANEIRL